VVKTFRAMLIPVLLLLANAASAELKIAVVNVQRAIGDTEEAKAAIAKIESDFKADQEEVRKLNAEINQMQEKFVKDSEVMGDAEKRKLQKEIEDKQTDYQYKVNKLQKAVGERQQDIINKMAPKFEAVLKDIITREKYDIVLHRQNVLYVDSALDISAQVTEALNKKQ
jgi:outer membrane protein